MYQADCIFQAVLGLFEGSSLTVGAREFGTVGNVPLVVSFNDSGIDLPASRHHQHLGQTFGHDCFSPVNFKYVGSRSCVRN